MTLDDPAGPVTIETVEAAATRLAGHVRHTPLLSSPFLDEIAGRRILVKPECLQHTGSFKFRGAWSAISALAPELREKGVVAYSSGNHAQGVALAAKMHGIPAVIVMPSDAPQLKLKNTAALGAEVVTYDRHGENREEIGGALAAERGLALIRPYDDPQVIAGQGTAGLEIAADAEALGIDRAEVLVCCGGGGLTSGIGLALEAYRPGFRVRPVEPVGFDDVARSLAAHERLEVIPGSRSICDAVVTPAPGELTFPILDRLCGPGMTASDEDVLFALAQAFRRLKIVLEPGGALSLAAALRQPDRIEGDTVIVVASGGNVDAAVFARALEMA
ncbi:threonine ammonia-lyase [Histidinibacterium aquaticum]|uniref:Threonine/serine dehydratase n=1 Tax=Histidinibacterium aquaticum TaxID=2613962 RepID=A0A5J5GJ71_9RHOB|nr:threonine/serine dehydratase [Histidinibacterium aquaticum]KAA9008167.1 threonine/serine dehydratase [Histidinibacterium aquaticum]